MFYQFCYDSLLDNYEFMPNYMFSQYVSNIEILDFLLDREVDL